jgi:hypothetical protein
MSGPYATATDLAGYWRPLSDVEQSRATVLLDAAGDLIDEQPGSVDFVETATKWVSLDMVKRAMVGLDGITSQSQAMGDMSVSQSFANPMGKLYITEKELQRLRGFGVGSKQFALVMTNNVRVPYTAWGYQYASQTDGAITPAPPG